MLKRVFFVRQLIVSVFFFLFVDVRATKEVNNSEQEEKQNFLRENILEKGYDVNEFVKFLMDQKGEEGADVNNWNMTELEKVVNEFYQHAEKQQFLRENIQEDCKEAFAEFLKSKKKEVDVTDIDIWTMEELRVVVEEFKKKTKKNVLKNLGEDEQIQAKKEIPKNNNFDGVNNNILQINNENNNGIKDEKKNLNKGNLFEENPNQSMQNNQFVQGPNDSINITHDQSSPNRHLYDLSHNKIARGVFDFYRHVGKFLTSLVWSVVNSYCGFEQLVMNDWYCFKYAMCSGYRLQPRFMRSRVWIDMNFNFLEGIAGFLIRFFIFDPSYDMYENIFDFFNVCIDIKVYNNLYFAVNVVGIVRSIVLLSILSVKLTSPFPETKKKNF